MKKLIIPLITLLSLVTLLSTGCSAIFRVTETGAIVKKTYVFENFTNLEISSAFKYDISQSDNYSLVVSAHENSFERMDIRQSGNTLFIGLKFGTFSVSDNSVTITMPQLNKLVVSGASTGSATGFNSTGELDINLSGASKLNIGTKAGKTRLNISGAADITGDLASTDTQITLSGASDLNMTLNTGNILMDVSGGSKVAGDLQALDADIRLSGASNCKITGSAGNTKLEASGASKINSPDLVLQNTDIVLTGASYSSIHTDGTLNIDISGASQVDYTGNPAIGKLEISGASTINHK